MFLDSMKMFGQTGQIVAAATLLLGGFGCMGGPDEAKQARTQNERMDWLDRQCRVPTASADTPAVATVRSQSPFLPPPDVKPVAAPSLITPTTGTEPTSNRVQGEAQVRIVATIGTTPIYEREVREAVYQRLPEFISLSTSERKAKEQAMFKEELRKIIERELILDELFAMLSNKKQSSALNSLKESATKDAENRIRDVQKRAGLQSENDLKMFLQSQGLSLAGLRRHFERSFMMSAFVSERLKPKISNVSLADIKDYYAEHGDEFMTTDRVKWQDLFVRNDYFPTPADAKKYVEWLLARVQRGEDFAKLINECDMGDSKSRGGFGFGEEKGKIFPPELEQTVFSIKQGQVSYMDFESGCHIVRVAERVYAGKRPFDEQVQNEIRRKIQGQISEREYRKIVDTMWRRSQPQILVD